MRSRIGVWCDQIIEGRLAAGRDRGAHCSLTSFSSRVFEPDKLGLVRAIATIMALGLGRAYTGRTGPPGHGRTRPASASPRRCAGPGLGAPSRHAFWPCRPWLWSSSISWPPPAPSRRAPACGDPISDSRACIARSPTSSSFPLALTILRRPGQLRRLLFAITLASPARGPLWSGCSTMALDPLPWGSERHRTRRLQSRQPDLCRRLPHHGHPADPGAGAGGPPARRSANWAGAAAAGWALWAPWSWLAQNRGPGAVAGMGAGLLSALALVGIAVWIGRRPGRALAPWIALSVYGWVLSVQLVWRGVCPEPRSHARPAGRPGLLDLDPASGAAAIVGPPGPLVAATVAALALLVALKGAPAPGAAPIPALCLAPHRRPGSRGRHRQGAHPHLGGRHPAHPRPIRCAPWWAMARKSHVRGLQSLLSARPGPL